MKGSTRYLRRSRVFLGATEGNFIDICVVRGMCSVVSEVCDSLFTSFTPVLRSNSKALVSIAVQTGVLTAHPESAPDGPFEC